MKELHLSDYQKILKIPLKRKGDFSEVYVEERTTNRITLEDSKIEKVVSGIDYGAGLRLISDERTYFAYTSELSFENVNKLAGMLSVQESSGDETEVYLEEKSPDRQTKYEILPGDVNSAKKAEMIKEADETARSVSGRIKQVSVVLQDVVQEILIVNSEGIYVKDKRIYPVFIVNVIAEKDGIVQTGYEVIGGLTGYEIFKEKLPVNYARTASERAVRMLESPHAPSGTMAVVLSSSAGGTMIHEAVGHSLEADLVQKGASQFAGKLNTKVASELITVVDDPTLENMRGSFAVDDEGTPAVRNVLIEKGALKNYMWDKLTRLRDKGELFSSNGRRMTYQHKPIPRMTNTMILPGQDNPEEIVKSTNKGLFVKKMGGGQVNTVNGDFVFEVSEGYLIEDGKVTSPVRGATLVGNSMKVLNSIDRVGNDLGFGIGTCGKDGQGVPVSDAQPTLRIPEVVVGGM